MSAQFVRSIKRINEDIFPQSHIYVTNPVKRRLVYKKSERLKILPPEILFEMFDTLIKPILTYSSDWWGINKSALHELHRSFINYRRCVVKLSTNSVIAFVESGKFSPTLYCPINIFYVFFFTVYRLCNQVHC